MADVHLLRDQDTIGPVFFFGKTRRHGAIGEEVEPVVVRVVGGAPVADVPDEWWDQQAVVRAQFELLRPNFDVDFSGDHDEEFVITVVGDVLVTPASRGEVFARLK